MAYFLGLDSGGTKTECWIGDEQRVLGRAVCGTVKLTRVGQEVATERLERLLKEAEASGGVALGRIERACVGVAGYSIARVREWIRRVVGERVGGEIVVCGDEEIALDAAFGDGAGILVIGGTGSIVVGRCGDGKRFTAGGWGPAIGDEGSGYWIGAEAVRAAFAAVDRGVQTELLEAVRQAWGAEDMGEVVGIANQRPGPDFAALAPLVMRVADAGDQVAQDLLVRAGEALGDQVLAVWDRMQAHQRQHGGEREGCVACTGSVLERVDLVRSAMTARLGDALKVQDGVVNSMDGAMWRARGGALRVTAR